MSWHNCDLWSVVWFSVKAMPSATTYSHFILLHPLTSSWKSKNSLYIFKLLRSLPEIPQSVSALYQKLKLNVKCYHWPFIYASAVCHNLVIAFRQICRVSTAFLRDDKFFESSQVLSCCKVLVLSLTELQIPPPYPLPSPPTLAITESHAHQEKAYGAVPGTQSEISNPGPISRHTKYGRHGE